MLTLLGFLLGFGTSFLPKVMDYFQGRQDADPFENQPATRSSDGAHFTFRLGLRSLSFGLS